MKILKVEINKETYLRNDCILVANRTTDWGDGQEMKEGNQKQKHIYCVLSTKTRLNIFFQF